MTLFTAEELTFGFLLGSKQKLVGERLTFEIQVGQVVAILGMSGIGKTTLLKVVGKLLPPLDGKATWGCDAQDIHISFQRPRLLPWKNLHANISLPSRLMGRKGPSVAETSVLLNRLNVDASPFAFPHELSEGMAARVSFCRMIAARPRLLLLDEPTAALDDLTKVLFMGELIDYVRESSRSAACALVTHDIGLALSYADTVLIVTGVPGSISLTIAKTEIEKHRNELVANELVERVRMHIRDKQRKNETP